MSLAARIRSAPPPAPRDGDAAIQPTAAPKDSRQAPASAGGVVLESKGYIIAAHQIQVSPIEVSGLIKEL